MLENGESQLVSCPLAIALKPKKTKGKKQNFLGRLSQQCPNQSIDSDGTEKMSKPVSAAGSFDMSPLPSSDTSFLALANMALSNQSYRRELETTEHDQSKDEASEDELEEDLVNIVEFNDEADLPECAAPRNPSNHSNSTKGQKRKDKKEKKGKKSRKSKSHSSQPQNIVLTDEVLASLVIEATDKIKRKERRAARKLKRPSDTNKSEDVRYSRKTTKAMEEASRLPPGAGFEVLALRALKQKAKKVRRSLRKEREDKDSSSTSDTATGDQGVHEVQDQKNLIHYHPFEDHDDDQSEVEETPHQRRRRRLTASAYALLVGFVAAGSILSMAIVGLVGILVLVTGLGKKKKDDKSDDDTEKKEDSTEVTATP